ncbi:hypothetical protein EVAR_10421_1 [Eumeta japonica]|uniref:Uncharacterized protein n=1 Tax=Eumeta variegata TaxID=151549 RepID=A0A4C1UE33_EUMVA|nr:hypothetical protein EVAR_10421_1 [Eumeta japonica]
MRESDSQASRQLVETERVTRGRAPIVGRLTDAMTRVGGSRGSRDVSLNSVTAGAGAGAGAAGRHRMTDSSIEAQGLESCGF